MTKMKTLDGKISSGAFESAVADALRSNMDAKTCRRLHMLSNSLSITKSSEAFESLANAYFFDAPALRTLVEEATAPVTMAFATAVLQSEAARSDSALAEELFKKVADDEYSYLRDMLDEATGSPDTARTPPTP